MAFGNGTLKRRTLLIVRPPLRLLQTTLTAWREQKHIAQGCYSKNVLMRRVD
jgi:hypothetical protein